ncbi:MAG: hypothetical protein FJX29_00470, partial [Alphaproteobacteria bacterium]|nr:hypothetical protein [Alphaproteobacteria bacterium]
MMKSIVLAAAISFAGFLAGSLAPTAAWAQSCEVQAVERKLAGAAKTSFMKKCEAGRGVEA